MSSGRDDLNLPVASPPGEARLTIGAFARAVGLSASALRQYGESGLLVPARIDEHTGYRYYSPAQQQRAIWIRRLRDAGLDLRRIRAVLDGDLTTAERLLGTWLADAQAHPSSAADLVADLRAGLRAATETNPLQRTTARFDGAVLAAAIDQVAVASADDDPSFTGVLLEVEPGRAAVFATDRRLLVARLSVASEAHGPGARVRLDTDSVRDWLRARPRVELVVDAPTGRDGVASTRAVLHDETGESLALPRLPDRFPSVRALLKDGSDATRVAVRRADALRMTRDVDVVTLTATGHDVTVKSDAGAAAGLAHGRPISVRAFAPTLQRIAKGAVGEWLTCDIGAADEALVWRDPSVPDLVALMMPRSA